MSFKEYQDQVDAWVNQYKEGYWDPLVIYARLGTEFGELGKELLHNFGPLKKKPTEQPSDIPDEIGDMIFTLICLANSLNIDLDDAFKRVMEKYSARDAQRFEKK